MNQFVNDMNNKWRFRLELLLAFILTISGIVMLFLGFYVNHTGEISHSVLVGVGETFTFAGALLGIDYSFRKQIYNKNKDT